MPSRRTTHRSTTGTKLYAVRDAKGEFMDIQRYSRAHRQDIQRSSAAERAARRKLASRKRTVRKGTSRKTTVRSSR